MDRQKQFLFGEINQYFNFKCGGYLNEVLCGHSMIKRGLECVWMTGRQELYHPLMATACPCFKRPPPPPPPPPPLWPPTTLSQGGEWWMWICWWLLEG